MNWKEKLKKEAKSLVPIIILILAFRSSFFEPFRVPSGSMIPTINIGDFVLVNKMSYGFKLPFSHFFGDPIYLTDFTPPEPGDVIVFKYPRDPSTNYIKRVVAVPGDKIEVINKQLFVNGKETGNELIDGKKLQEDMVESYRTKTFQFYKGKLGDEEFVYQITSRMSQLDNVTPLVVPEDSYFVMGDNRDFSADSRVWGFVPKNLIKGKGILIWFSLSLPFDGHEIRFRPSKIGTLL